MKALSALLIDPATGGVSATLLWMHIGYIAATCVFVMLARSGHMDVEIFSAYLLIVALHVSGDKFMSLKYGPRGDH